MISEEDECVMCYELQRTPWGFETGDPWSGIFASWLILLDTQTTELVLPCSPKGGKEDTWSLGYVLIIFFRGEQGRLRRPHWAWRTARITCVILRQTRGQWPYRLSCKMQCHTDMHIASQGPLSGLWGYYNLQHPWRSNMISDLKSGTQITFISMYILLLRALYLPLWPPKSLWSQIWPEIWIQCPCVYSLDGMNLLCCIRSH